MRWTRVAGRLALASAFVCVWACSESAAQEPGTVVAADRRVQGRTYTFEGTGAAVPYALFVPSKYNAASKWPLIVGLHGLGRPYDWLMGYEGIIDFAERDGFIMVTPLGYHPRGWYGSRGAGVPQGARQNGEAEGSLPANLGELSEKDVMNVLAIARKEFNVDPNRIYLWGHSMGGAGTYHLAAKHPELWAALAVAAPAPLPTLEPIVKFKHLPILVLQGDEDKLVPVTTTRSWVARMAELGMQHMYVEIKGGDHSLFVSKNRETLSKIFSFFNIAKKTK